jgi:Transposase IS66 family
LGLLALPDEFDAKASAVETTALKPYQPASFTRGTAHQPPYGGCDGRIEINSNCVVRSMRAVVLSRKNSLFADSNEGAGKLGFPLPRL